jgi:hypothetical protein
MPELRRVSELMNPRHVGGEEESPPAGFTCDAVTFDGTNDYLELPSPTGAADSSQVLFSALVNTLQGDVGSLANVTGAFDISLNNGDLSLTAVDATASSIFIAATSGAGINDGVWHHIALSLDTNFGAGSRVINLAVDGGSVAMMPSLDTGSAFQIPLAGKALVVGKDASSNMYDGDLAEVYFAPGHYLDITQAANNQKFRDTNGKPVDLGAAGSTPTGTAPLVYLHIDNGEAAANFALNAGSGGDFTVNGALATAASSPSD